MINFSSRSLLILLVFFGVSSCVVKHKVLESPPAKVQNVENELDKNENYIKANEWMVETFNNAESVIQFTDKEAGIIKGKYVMREGVTSSSAYAVSIPAFSVIITLRVKEGASRIEIDSPKGMYSQKVVGVEYGFTPEMFNASANILLKDFETRMLAKAKNTDW
jgi:hypothetical protein